MKKLLLIALCTCMSGCTISIIQTDTHGQATDVVDSIPTTRTETDPNISVPATKLM